MEVWCSEKVPYLWGKSTVVLFFRKGARSGCANRRGVGLIAVGSTLHSSVILRRLSIGVKGKLLGNRLGFAMVVDASIETSLSDKCWSSPCNLVGWTNYPGSR